MERLKAVPEAPGQAWPPLESMVTAYAVVNSARALFPGTTGRPGRRPRPPFGVQAQRGTRRRPSRLLWRPARVAGLSSGARLGSGEGVQTPCRHCERHCFGRSGPRCHPKRTYPNDPPAVRIPAGSGRGVRAARGWFQRASPRSPGRACTGSQLDRLRGARAECRARSPNKRHIPRHQSEREPH